MLCCSNFVFNILHFVGDQYTECERNLKAQCSNSKNMKKKQLNKLQLIELNRTSTYVRIVKCQKKSSST